MTASIAFQREGKVIIGNIIKTVLEPLDGKHQVVFFCESKGKRYRVPKSEVLVTGRAKKKARKSA